MSGVQTGTYLERLEQLQLAVQHELEQERARVARGHVSRAPRSAPPLHPPARAHDELQLERMQDRLVRVPLEWVLSSVVRDWARSLGYLDKTTGPLGLATKAAFIEAHR